MRERPRAIAAATAAVAAVDRLLEVAKVRPSAPVARDSSSAFAMLALLQAEDGDAAAAFESAERMRTHDLRLLLAPGEREIFRGMTDQEREEERKLTGELVSLHAQLARERGLPKPDAARIARLDAAAAEATQKRAAQQQALFDRLPALRTWRGLMPAATRADVDRLLPDAATILVEFVIGEDTLLVILARRGEDGVRFSTQFEPASRRAMAERAAKLQQPETLRDAGAWRTAALELIPGLPATFGCGDSRDRHPARSALARALRSAASWRRLPRRHDFVSCTRRRSRRSFARLRPNRETRRPITCSRSRRQNSHRRWSTRSPGPRQDGR